MVDPVRLRSLLDELGGRIDRLEQVAARPAEDLAQDELALAAVKYWFVVAIEICIDAAHHVIASERLRAPEDFADAFTAVGEADMLPADLVDLARQMARFRNLLVHVYGEVDDRRVVEILQTRLTDLRRLRAEFAALAAGDDGEDGA